jgi:predicted HicB family RNase H-like nuclease
MLDLEHWEKQLVGDYLAVITADPWSFHLEIHHPDGEITVKHGYSSLDSAKAAYYRIRKRMVKAKGKLALKAAARSLKAPVKEKEKPTFLLRLLLPKELHGEIKKRAQEQETTVSDYYRTIIREHLHLESVQTVNRCRGCEVLFFPEHYNQQYCSKCKLK